MYTLYSVVDPHFVGDLAAGSRACSWDDVILVLVGYVEEYKETYI